MELENVELPYVEVEDTYEAHTAYNCLNCDNSISPDDMFCSELCDTTYNEDLKAEMEDLRKTFRTKNLLDD